MSGTTYDSRAIHRNEPGTAPAIWLTNLTDTCIYGSLLVAPLFMGGRGAVGQLVFVVLSCLAALAWSTRQTLVKQASWRFSGVEWLLFAGGLLVAAQLLPVSTASLLKCAPTLKEILPLWVGEVTPGHLGQWSTISLTPEATRSSLVMYLSYLLLFVVVLQRLHTVNEITLLLRVVAIAALLMAILGLAQFFSGADKFLWVYEHPSRSPSQVVRGAFQNENHFAHFLTLGLGPLIWWLCSATKGHSASSRSGAAWHRSARGSSAALQLQIPLILMSTAVIVLAVLLTFSRGGVLIMAISLVASLAVMRSKHFLDRRTTIILSTATVISVLGIFIFGLDSLSLELGTIFKATSLGQLFRGRTELWSATCEGISKFYVAGTGIGSFRDIYPIFMEEYYPDVYTHGESGYLPLLLEGGVVGLGLMVIGIAVCFKWCLGTIAAPVASNDGASQSDLIGCACAICPSLVISVLHSIADFVWYIPACMVMTIIQVAAICRLYQLSRPLARRSHSPASSEDDSRQVVFPGKVGALITCMIVFGSYCMIQNYLGPALAASDWNAYKLVRNRYKVGTTTASVERDLLSTMEQHLATVVQYEPRNPEAHALLANIYLRQFNMAQLDSENAMDLKQIRDAALASQFPSKAAQDAWLDVAIGKSKQLLDKAQLHSRTAVSLSPLFGEVYVQLSHLSFMESANPELKSLYIDQAVRVRPHNADVLYMRGEEATLVGDDATAFRFWKGAFQKGNTEVCQQIIDKVAAIIPAKAFVTIFGPDRKALGQLYQRYAANGQVEEAQFAANLFIAALRKDAAASEPVEAAMCWSQAQAAYAWLGDAKNSLNCQRQAVDACPLDFHYRVNLARLLVQQSLFTEAIEHFEWCLRRRPENEELRRELADAKVKHLQATAQPRVADKSGVQKGS